MGIKFIGFYICSYHSSFFIDINSLTLRDFYFFFYQSDFNFIYACFLVNTIKIETIIAKIKEKTSYNNVSGKNLAFVHDLAAKKDWQTRECKFYYS